MNECDSTQDVLKEQLRTHGSSRTLLVSCENQLKGRGRGDHTWENMSGTLCLSLSLDAHAIPSFTSLEMSVLVARFFEQKGRKLKLKWPNDLFNANGAKCCGILIQNGQEKMVVGIGLNLFSDRPEFGGIFESGFEIDKKNWAHELAEFIVSHRYHGPQDLKNDWEARCLHWNQDVVIKENNEEFKGKFISLGQHGEAVLKSHANEIHVYNGSLIMT